MAANKYETESEGGYIDDDDEAFEAPQLTEEGAALYFHCSQLSCTEADCLTVAQSKQHKHSVQQKQLLSLKRTWPSSNSFRTPSKKCACLCLSFAL